VAEARRLESDGRSRPGGSPVLHASGFRLSLAGGVVFLVGLIGLVVLPDVLPAVVMMAGGIAVWVGFIWTLLSFYLPGPRPPND
jgi:hypothetical protein